MHDGVVGVTTSTPAETFAWGERLGRLLSPGDFVALTGELGSGKTQFVKGVAVGLGVDPGLPITSPTFTLLNIHHGRIPLYHFDLYRLDGVTDVEELGFNDYFEGDGACLVEWAERLGSQLPADCLTVLFAHAGEECRELTFVPHGGRARRLLAELGS